jgi:hypothetical protein
VFGGRTNRALNISFQADRNAAATVRVFRAGRVVSQFTRRNVPARRTVRLRLGASKLRRGNYLVQITVSRPGQRSVRSVLTARRL